MCIQFCVCLPGVRVSACQSSRACRTHLRVKGVSVGRRNAVVLPLRLSLHTIAASSTSAQRGAYASRGVGGSLIPLALWQSSKQGGIRCKAREGVERRGENRGRVETQGAMWHMEHDQLEPCAGRGKHDLRDSIRAVEVCLYRNGA